MGIMASNKGGDDFRQLDPGNHLGRLFQIVDIGHQHSEYQGKPNVRHQVIFRWECPFETEEFDGQVKPLIISAFYTLSTGERSNLRPVMEGWLSRPLTFDEIVNVDVTQFLGKCCMLNVIHKDGKARVESVGAVPKGFPAPPPAFNPITFFSIDPWDDNAFEALPKGFKKFIMQSDEYKDLHNPHRQADPAKPALLQRTEVPGAKAKGIDEDDIPF